MCGRVGMRLALFVVCGLVGVAAPARAGDAPAPAAERKAKVDALTRGLESNEPTTRAEAATELGTLFPEAAVAVPTLVDAAADDDEKVRNAAVIALRRLGNAGIDEVVRQTTSLSGAPRSTVQQIGAVLAFLGAGEMPMDAAAGLTGAVEEGPTSPRGAMLMIAAAHPWFGWRLAKPHEAPMLFAIAAPWVSSPDRDLAGAAAATLAISGRAIVADEGWDSATQADLASPDALAPLLMSNDTAARWIAWGVAVGAAPHGNKTVAAISAAWEKFKTRLDDRVDLDLHRAIPDAAFGRPGAIALVRSVGPRVGAGWNEASTPAARADATQAMELLTSFGRDDEAVARLWKTATAGRLDPLSGIPAEFLLLAPRVPSLRDAAAKDVLPGFDRLCLEDKDARVLVAIAPKLSFTDRERMGLTDSPIRHLVASTVLVLSASRQAVPAASRLAAARILANSVRSPSWSALSLRAEEAISSIPRGLDLPTGPFVEVLASANLDPHPSGTGHPSALPEAIPVPPEEEGGPAEPSATTDIDGAATIAELLARSGRVPAAAIPALDRLVSLRPAVPEVKAEDRARFARGMPYVQNALGVLQLGVSYSSPERARLAAIDALGRIEGDSTNAKQALTPLLKVDDAQVRYRAARALRRLEASK